MSLKRQLAQHAPRNGHVPSRNPTDEERKNWNPTDGGIPREQRGPELSLICMADVVPTKVEWLWPSRIAMGKLTTFAGPPGVGKTFVSCADIPARVTIGAAWPDDSETPATEGEVIVFSAEDGLADTLRPRLDAAGADVSKVFVVRCAESTDLATGKPIELAVRLDRDIAALDNMLTAKPGARLLVFDPISEYLGNVDSHKNAEVRRVLVPLALLAERHNVAVVAVTHFNKGAAGPAIYRGMGSLAFVALARSAWAFVADTENKDRVLFLPLKSNLAKQPPGLAYSIVDGRVVWEADAVNVTADEAMNASPKQASPDKLDEAMDWLRERLSGGCVESQQLTQDAEAAGISFRTYQRAKGKLGCRSVKSRLEFGGKWFVSMPDSSQSTQTTDEECQPPNTLIGIVGTVGTVGTLEGRQGRQGRQDVQGDLPPGRDF